MLKKTLLPGIFVVGILIIGGGEKKKFDVDAQLNYCLQQANEALSIIPSDTLSPRYIPKSDTSWHYVDIHSWTSGFWPGILWYLYQYTQDRRWKVAADSFPRALKPDAYTVD